LVNSRARDADTDPLRSREAFRDFVADRPFLAVQITQHDLDQLKLLRAELACVFSSAAGGAGLAAAERLNTLMTIHPVQPMLVAHDGEPLHVHLNEAGSITDRYAAASVISLALLLSQLGAERLGVCAIASCEQVFIDGSSNRSRRYCSDHSAARSNVTSLRQRHNDATDDAATTSAVS
jgi:predicted RNA-binding Zn ribbon-like protein